MKLLISVSLFLSAAALSSLGTAQSCDVLLRGSDINGNERSGFSVDLSGNLIASGAPKESALNSSEQVGAVYIHRFETTTASWVEVEKLQPITLSGLENFGASLEFGPTSLVVGTPNALGGLASSSGSVYVLSHDGNGNNWVEDQVLTPSNGMLGDQFGWSVAMDDGTLLVGAPEHQTANSGTGVVYVFQKSGGAWVESQIIESPFGPTNSGFGTVVALSDGRAVIGGAVINNTGALASYEIKPSGQFSFGASLTPANLGIADFFATSVDLVGDLLVVGTPFDDDIAGNAGAVHVFRFDAVLDAFVEEDKLTYSRGASADHLGSSVATDGATIMVGADGLGVAGGAVAYRMVGGVWTDVRKVQPEELGVFGQAGNAVAVDGDRGVMGDSSDDSAFFLGGATFVTDLSLADANGNGIGDLCEDIGVNYCDPAVANTTGVPGTIRAFGSPYAADQQLTLEAKNLPTFVFGIFLTSPSQGFVAHPGGSEGNLCLSGAIGRYNNPNQIFSTTTHGQGSLILDFTQTPTPNVPVTIAAGETWNFQAWYRDNIGGQSVSNFTDAVSVSFQ